MPVSDQRVRYLYEAWRAGSMRAAAEKMDVAPSSISRQISALEAEIGMPIIEHGRRDIRLTDAGQRLVEYHTELESNREKLADDLADLAGNVMGRVNIGIGEGFLGSALFRSFDDLYATYPGIAMSVRVTDTVDMTRMIADDELHFGMAFHPTNEARIASRFSTRIPLCVIAPPDHPIAGRHEARLDILEGEPLALLEQRFRMRQLIDLAAIESRACLSCTLETNSISLLVEYVRARRACTVLPAFSVRADLEAGLLAAVPLSESVLQGLYVHLIARTGRKFSKPALLMMNSLRRHLGEVAR